MRKLFSILIAVLLTATVSAQAPEKMSYQAVIRNNSDQLVVNMQVGMKISIQKYVLGIPPTYQNVYVETHTPTTNKNGLVSLKIGDGNVVGGVFANIDWSVGEYFIKTETDPTGGTNYTISGTTQLLSVPYALYAKNAKTYKVGDFAHGGIVFWVDESGQHGLVCAKSDQGTAMWYAGTNIKTMARGNGPKSGELNTAIIIASQGEGTGVIYAARLCNELLITEGGKSYGDWYLPSISELVLMYNNRNIINATAIANGGSNFSTDFYTTSTETGGTTIYGQSFSGGNVSSTAVKFRDDFKVRAIRAF